MIYDCAILGGGPGGLAAAVYAARYKIKAVVITKEVGGYLLDIAKIENYPGFEEISGFELADRMKKQVKALGVEIVERECQGIIKTKNGFDAVCCEQEKYSAKTLILAMGTKRRELQIPGEKEFLGKGVSFCATCDAPLFKDKTVVVVGGSNAAISSVIMLSEYAKKIYLIYRKDKLRGEPLRIEKIEKDPKVEIIFKTNLQEIKGEGQVKSIILDQPYQGKNEIATDGVFVEIGGVPNTAFFNGLGLKTTEEGNIEVNPFQQTNIKGVFAAGDITNGSGGLRQIVTACSEGAVAATSVYKFIKEGKIEHEN